MSNECTRPHTRLEPRNSSNEKMDERIKSMTKLLFHAEQRRELLLALAGEIHDPVARRARRPFQFIQPVEDRRTQRAREMAAPRAPVEAALAQRPPGMGELGDVDLQFLGDEFLALSRQRDLVAVPADQLLPRHG